MAGFAVAQSSALNSEPAMDVGTTEPVAFWDAASRQIDLMHSVERADARGEQTRAAMWDRLGRIKKATGQSLTPSDEMTGESRLTSWWTAPLQHAIGMTQAEQDLEDQIEKLRAERPGALAGVETRAAMQARLQAGWNAKAARAAAGGNSAQGKAGGIVGGLAGSLMDPGNLEMTIMTGGLGAGRPLVTRMLSQAAANAGITAVEAPGRMAAAERYGGPKYELGDAAVDTAFSGVAGAGFELGAAGLKRLARPFLRPAALPPVDGAGEGAYPTGVARDVSAANRAAQILDTGLRDDLAIGARAPDEITAAARGLVSGELPAVTPDRDLGELFGGPQAGAVEYRGRAIHPRSFDPMSLNADPGRFQYKAGGDEEGVTARLRGVEAWDATASGKVLAFEDLDGTLTVADGHQRRALAQRMIGQGWDARLDGYLFRAADGWTAPQVRVVAALKNIREGQGSPLDAAKVFREAPQYLTDRSLPVSGEFIAQGRGLARLSDEAFGATVNQVIPERYAAEIGALAAERPDLHMGMVRLFKAADPANVDEARALVIEALQDDWLKSEPDQGDLFGYDGSQSAMIARAKIAATVKRSLASDARLFGQLIKHADAIEAGGNALARDANEARLAIDRTALEVTAKLALRSGPIGDAMAQAVARVAKGDAPGTAARDVLKRVREAVEAGESLDAMRAQAIDPAAPSEASQALVRAFDEPVGEGAKAQTLEAPEDAAIEADSPGLFDDLPQVTAHEKAHQALLACVPAE